MTNSLLLSCLPLLTPVTSSSPVIALKIVSRYWVKSKTKWIYLSSFSASLFCPHHSLFSFVSLLCNSLFHCFSHIHKYSRFLPLSWSFFFFKSLLFLSACSLLSPFLPLPCGSSLNQAIQKEESMSLNRLTIVRAFSLCYRRAWLFHWYYSASSQSLLSCLLREDEKTK